MFTILSYSLTNEVGKLNVQIHGHYEAADSSSNISSNTEVSSDQILKKCVMENTTAAPSSASYSATSSASLESSDDGFIFCPTMDSNGWQGLPNGEKFGMVYDANTITVWEKFGRPGRLYGETPKKRLIRVFQKVAYNGGVMVLAPPKPPKSTVVATLNVTAATATSTTIIATTQPKVADKHVNFNNVVVELKERLAKRQAKMLLDKSLDRFEPPTRHRMNVNRFQVNPFYQATQATLAKEVEAASEVVKDINSSKAASGAATHENLNQLIEEILAEIRHNKRTYSITITSDDEDEEETGDYYEDRDGSIIEYSEEEEEEISSTAPMDIDDDNDDNEQTQRYWNWASPSQSQEVLTSTEYFTWPYKSWPSSNDSQSSMTRSGSERRDFDAYSERLEKELETYHNVVCDWKNERGERGAYAPFKPLWN